MKPVFKTAAVALLAYLALRRGVMPPLTRPAHRRIRVPHDAG